MTRLGLIGGMSWPSTAAYCDTLHREMARHGARRPSASMHLISLDSDDVARRLAADDWPGLRERVLDAARRLERSGAERIVLCSNSLHRLAADLQRQARVPLLHIAEPTVQVLRAAGLGSVGLLGSRATLEHPAYMDFLGERGIASLLPRPDERGLMQRILNEELRQGLRRQSSRERLQRIGMMLVDRGAEALVLASTALGPALGDVDFGVPVFDTARLHALAAAEAMSEGQAQDSASAA